MARKSVLVIDTPKCCVDCDLMYDYLYCSANQEERNMTGRGKGRPKGCPLRPLPERKSYGVIPRQSAKSIGASMQNCINYGWNKCLNEITGENFANEINTDN